MICIRKDVSEEKKLLVSERSKSLTGVTQLKIGDVCLYMCLDVSMSFCNLTFSYFCVSSLFDPVPNFTKRNPPA